MRGVYIFRLYILALSTCYDERLAKEERSNSADGLGTIGYNHVICPGTATIAIITETQSTVNWPVCFFRIASPLPVQATTKKIFTQPDGGRAAKYVTLARKIHISLVTAPKLCAASKYLQVNCLARVIGVQVITDGMLQLREALQVCLYHI